MAEVDFSDVESAEAWFKTQTPEVRSIAANRAALRYLALLCEASAKHFEPLTLNAFRYVLISATRGVEALESTSSLESAGRRAIKSGETAFKKLGLHSGRPVSAYAISGMSVGASDDPSTAAMATVIAPNNRNASLADFKNQKLNLSQEALWMGVRVPENILTAHDNFIKILSTSSSWSFFRDWYQKMWTGSFENWPLAKKVALIHDEIWREGLEAVAGEIERIQAEFSDVMERPNSVPKLEQTKLIKHVKQLLASPEMTALSAEGAAETLERAIKEYMNQAPANCLPDELTHLDALPSLFRSIARTVKSNDLGEAKETRLLEQIIALNAKVAQLEADLKAAKEKTLNGRFKIKAIESLGTTIGSPWFLGAMALATSHFFGLSPSEITFENLRNYTSDVLGAEPMSVDTNERYRDVSDL